MKWLGNKAVVSCFDSTTAIPPLRLTQLAPAGKKCLVFQDHIPKLMAIHKDFCVLKEGRPGKALESSWQRGLTQHLSGILLASCEIVAGSSEHAPFLSPLTSQQAAGALQLLPASDDSGYFHQHLLPSHPHLLHFLLTATNASRHTVQFYF